MTFPLGHRVAWREHEGHVLVGVENFDAIDCETCRFAHVIPVPSEQALTAYYRTSFYEESKPDYFDVAERDRQWKNIGFDSKLQMLESAIDSAKTRRILDIGSGPGHFLLRAKERGWTAVGVEASPAAAECSRRLNIEVYEGYFNGREGLNLGYFNAIHMQHVLEHVPDPADLLRRLTELLLPGGAICLEVPNDFSIVQEVLHTEMNFPAWWVAPPEHLNFFSRDSLTLLLRSSGYEPVEWTSQFPIDLALIAGVDYVNDPAVGSSIHDFRKALEVNLTKYGPHGLVKEMYKALLDVGLGRQLVVVARRKA